MIMTIMTVRYLLVLLKARILVRLGSAVLFSSQQGAAAQTAFCLEERHRLHFHFESDCACELRSLWVRYFSDPPGRAAMQGKEAKVLQPEGLLDSLRLGPNLIWPSW